MRNLAFVFIFSILIFQSCDRKKYDTFNIDKEKLIHGIVIGIYDGDTYSLFTDDNKTLKVRMEGIDAPERKMPFYKASRNELSKLIYKKKVFLKNTGEDVHGRILGFTYLENGIDVNIEMLKAGMVWHFKRYNDDDNYAKTEEYARNLKIGLWKDANPEAPWTFRRNNRYNF